MDLGALYPETESFLLQEFANFCISQLAGLNRWSKFSFGLKLQFKTWV